MRIEIMPDDEATAIRAADLICAVVRARPEAVLGLPTGATPVETYFELKRRQDRGEVDFANAVVFAIEEFAGGTRATPGTNNAFFRQYLRVPLRALHIPNPAADDPDEHIAAFAEAIQRAGGLDLCVLGVGVNGHIAFNEPGSERESRARSVLLAPETCEQHAAAFGSIARVPARGVTLGIADILDARALLVMAMGEHKAEAVARALEGEAAADAPASWLKEHDDVTWLLDVAAASQLSPESRMIAAK